MFGSRWVCLGLIAPLPLLTSCSGRADGESVELVVSAASSLTDAFGEIKEVYEAAHPDIEIQLNFGGSSTLREQILAGAPADVFASANPENIEALESEDGLVGRPRDFATNSLMIAVPADNPGSVSGLDDFGNPALAIGLCAEGVPCGAFAREALDKNGTTPSVDTNEPDVRALLAKVELGELDAAIVYATDIASAGSSVVGIEIPRRLNVIAVYLVAILSSSPRREEALAFVTFLLGAEGQRILGDFGFGAP